MHPARLPAAPSLAPKRLVLVRPSVSTGARAERGEKRTPPLLLQHCTGAAAAGDGSSPVFPGPVTTQGFFKSTQGYESPSQFSESKWNQTS